MKMDAQTPANVQSAMSQIGGHVPGQVNIADPTVLTTQQLWREIAALKELSFTRFDSMERAIIVAHEDLVRVPTDVQKTVGTLRDLHEEKFHSTDRRIDDRVIFVSKQLVDIEHLITERFSSIQQQFGERDKRTELLSINSDKAVSAALNAAKEAVDKQNESFLLSINKSETATTKQIDGMQSTISGLTKAFDDKITDLKDRITRNEGADLGKKESSTSNGAMWGYLVGGIGALLGIAGFIMAMLRMAAKA